VSFVGAYVCGENPIRFRLDEGIATVTLDRPAQRNPLSIEAMNGLHEMWEQIDQDPDVRVVILTSSDRGGNEFNPLADRADHRQNRHLRTARRGVKMSLRRGLKP
jgi:enoyl-CoA hydratase/carnithine racemase